MSTQHTSPRLPYTELAPQPYRAMVALSMEMAKASIGLPLVDLVYLRVSQLNGCAYCVDTHWRDLIEKHGEDPRRINSLITWHESPFFTERERAALAWVDAVTDIQSGHAPDECFDALRAHFSDREITELTWAVATMSAWNRLGISMRNAIKV